MAILSEHINNKKLNNDDAENRNDATEINDAPLNPYERDSTQETNENENSNNTNNTNENINFTLSTLMPSNLLDASATNITTLTSNQVNDATEILFHSINELKEQVKDKTMKSFTSITTVIWESH